MELPPETGKNTKSEADESKSVIVFKTSDRSLLPIVKAMLDENGIIFLLSSATINRATTPIFQFSVNETELDRAKELLEGLE